MRCGRLSRAHEAWAASFDATRKGSNVVFVQPLSSARHAMGKHIIAKTGNIAAVQKQLGHRQATYAMQYARATTEELGRVLDDR